MSLETKEEIYPILSQLSSFPFIRHPHCLPLLQLLEKWKYRFPVFFDDTVYNELAIFFNFASNLFLDRHSTWHILRILLTIDYFRNKLLSHLSFIPHSRHVLLRFLPTRLIFPFSSKSVLGCLIVVTLKNGQEVLTIDNFQSLIDKLLPSYQLVPGMSYLHPIPHSSIKSIYFELEKKSGEPFTVQDKKEIRQALVERLEGELPRFIRPIFAPRNQEEVYKNILQLSEEIRSTTDLPHLMISLDQQKDDELVFLILLVYVSLAKPIQLEKLFNQENPRVKFVSEHLFPVTFLEGRFPVLSHTFRLHITNHLSFHRSDGSLHFCEARRHVVDLLHSVIGEFRDCNGGLLLKLDEQLSSLKDHFSSLASHNLEIVETLFYSILPLEKQATLATLLMQEFFSHSLKAFEFRPTHAAGYYYVQDMQPNYFLATVRLPASPFQQTVRAAFEELALKTALPITWSMAQIRSALSITFLIEQPYSPAVEAYVNTVQDILERWVQQVEGYRVCRAALGPKAPSLDPRIGSDENSGSLLRMLFEGLTRLNSQGQIEGAIAESISISSDRREYVFKLRPSFWNDGTALTAHDFAYAWKKTLSPQLELSFAYFLYPILNAQGVKEGRLSEDQLGIEVIDDYSLKVILEHPVSYFLELLSHPITFPVHRTVDQQSPHWASEVGSSYPCNGPFQLMINHPNYGYQLVKNPLYWDSAHFPLDQMIFLCINSKEAQTLFQRQELDLLNSPFGSPFDHVRSEFSGEKYHFSEYSTLWCLFNTEIFPFNHMKFRQALSLSLDSEKLFKKLYPTAVFTPSVLPPNLSLDSSTTALEYNLSKAKVLLQEFLEENGIQKEKFPPITLSCIEQTQIIASYLKHTWESNLNIQCVIKEEPWDLLYQKYKTGHFQAGILRWMSRFNDPSYTLNAFRYSSQVANLSRWKNLTYQVLLDQADCSLNQEEKRECIRKAEKLLNREQPIIPLFHLPYECLKRSEIDPCFLARCGFFKSSK